MKGETLKFLFTSFSRYPIFQDTQLHDGNKSLMSHTSHYVQHKMYFTTGLSHPHSSKGPPKHWSCIDINLQSSERWCICLEQDHQRYWGEAGAANLFHSQPGWILLSSPCSTTFFTILSTSLLRWLHRGPALQPLRKVLCSLQGSLWLWLWRWRWPKNHLSLRSVLLRTDTWWLQIAETLVTTFLWYSLSVVLFNALWYTSRCCHWST